jgi:hypothetical protein
MNFTQPLTIHSTLNEAVATAATWRRVTGRRFAIRADHTYGWGNKPYWSVVGQR